MKFAHLHVHSHYSLLDGLAKIDDLIAKTKEHGYESIALTDHGAMYGIPEFYKKAKAGGIKPILGVEAYLALESRLLKRPKIDDKRYHITLLAKNYQGYKNLLKITTRANLEGFYYKPRVDKELLKEHKEGVIALSGCLAGELSRLIIENNVKEAEKKLKEYLEIFGENFFLELNYHRNIQESAVTKKKLLELGKKFGIPCVATYDTHYLNPEDAEAHDILVAVQTGNKVSDSERLSLKIDDFSLCPQATMEALYEDAPEALENAAKISEMCDVSLDFGNTLLPEFPLPEGKNLNGFLRELCEKGLEKKFGEKTDPKFRERMDFELGVIEKTGFAGYFLIVQDFVNWAKNSGIIVGPGRGSAAGSFVSFLTGITDVDPIKYDLLFERFLNPDRISMPDIDMDFTDTRREEVINYLKQKYGEDHISQIITFGTMAARAAVRDTGRALGLSYSFCDSIAKLIPLNASLNEALEQSNELKDFYDRDPEAQKLIDQAKKLEGVVRHASIHACGTLITKNALTEYTPLQKAPQNENSIITQYDMYSVEMLGLLKMDLLGLRNLTIIEETLEIIEAVQHKKIKLEELPEKDPAAYRLFQKAETIGVFQLESEGMRRYLKEMKPNDFEDIVAMLALYRPGPIELIPQYIRRKHGKEEVKYIHPKLAPILEKTYGIGIYQEQMMRIARDLAGYSLAEADTLRKAIGKKIKELLDQQKEKLINGMIKNGINQKIAEAIWELFPPFAKYGFNRSHTVCYAKIAYQTAFLKANYPVEFMAALMNNEATETERAAELIGEANRMKIKILAPDINESFKKFGVVPEKNEIRFGLQAIKNVGQQISEEIIRERKNNGQYVSVEDFLRRICHKDLNRKSLESLVRAGALDRFAERGMLYKNLDEMIRFSQDCKKCGQNPQIGLFSQEMSFAPLKMEETAPLSIEEKLRWERELLGLYISGHPTELYREILNKKTSRKIGQVDESILGKLIKIGGVINDIKKIITKTGKPMLIVKLEDQNETIEVVVFPKTLEKTLTIWEKDRILIIEGRVDKNNNQIKIVCENAYPITTK